MPSPFPVELWTRIARFAIEKPWEPARFLPPVGDFACVEGFAKSSTAFRKIIRMLKSEVLVLSLSELLRVKRGFVGLEKVRYLEVYLTDSILCFFYEADFWPNIIESLQCFSMVTHLSLSHPGRSFRTLEALSKFPIARTLRYLEIVGNCAYVPEKSSGLCFPNLSHLCLAKHMKKIEIIDEEAVRLMASYLCGCPKLELFSFHVALHDRSEWNQQAKAHMRSLGYFLPSEGCERHIANCPQCWDAYDHDAVARRECAMTRLLAERLPNLSEVRWANLWVQPRKGESGQLVTRITRDGTVRVWRETGV